MSDKSTSVWLDDATSEFWEPLPSELRWISTLGRLRQGVRELQMAWRSRRDGRIEWRTIPLHVVSDQEFAP